MDATTHDVLWARWRRCIFATSWITYASFYLGRVNLAVALPALQGQFGWTKAQAGLIGSAFFWAYAVGQLVNGAFGDRVNGRAFVAVGLLMSALVNLAFGLARCGDGCAGLHACPGVVACRGTEFAGFSRSAQNCAFGVYGVNLRPSSSMAR